MSSRLSIRAYCFTPACLLAALFIAGCGSTATNDRNTNADDGSDTDGKADAWDNDDAPSVFGLSSLTLAQIQDPSAMKGYLPSKPWSDTYWPLNKKGLSFRWIGKESFARFEDQRDDAIDAFGAHDYTSSWKLSPAEKYDFLVGDASYSMTKEGWDVYSANGSYDDWGWMGHCHGWAPAAYLEEAPKAGVMATVGDNQVLFTEGDIRGLLTKAHAENDTAGGTRYMGTRCNTPRIIRDENGRIVDGTLYDAKPNAPDVANMMTARTIYIDQNSWNGYYILTYAESLDAGDVKIMAGTTEAREPEGAVMVETFASWDDYYAGKVEDDLIFFYNKECRDTNAGSFHLALVQFLSDKVAPEKKRGFVMDITREDEVWNQPAYGFESTIASVENLDDTHDPFAPFRAKGTVQIAHVETKVFYGVEAGPYVDYTESNGSMISSITYRYSLEIDANGFVIGGEWDSGSSAPDFLWVRNGALMDSPEVSYTQISKIHGCSLEIDRARSLTLPTGQQIEVVDCTL